LAVVSVVAVAVAASTHRSARAVKTREVLLVGNNWDGTADIIDVRKLKRIARYNVVPDRTARMAEIASNPESLAYFLAIRQEIGEGHDQLVDDMFASRDGKEIYASRPSFSDVIALNLRTRKIRWRVKVDGNRSDHMAISPDGRRLLVSASTANVVDVIDTKQGKIVGSFPSGDTPHENNFSRDGRRIYHASIGRVYTPNDSDAEDASKGKRIFEIVDARTLKVLRTIDFGAELRRQGITASSGVRPMAISPDEHFVYVQLSFLSGFVEYDLRARRVTRAVFLPLSEKAKGLNRQDYPLDSAHHGLAMSPGGTKLCAAGTISDYAAIVRRPSLQVQRITRVGKKPYWSTSDLGGHYCFVSNSETDNVSVISWKTAKEVKRISVGDHPQRMRPARIRVDLLR
jgi:YVTN family beta-propeller protein